MFQTAETVIAPQLDSNERLLWSGQPRQGIRFRAQDIILIPFSLMWGGFAIIWEAIALFATASAPGPINPVAFIFPLFGLPFVCIGLYLIFGRFFVDARSRSQTFYGVTNERIIVIRGLFSQQTKSLQLRTLSDISLSQKNDGSGTISFGPMAALGGLFFGSSWPGASRYAPPAFDLIENVKEAYDIIRNAQKASFGSG